VHGIVDVAVRAELGTDVLVAEQALLGPELVPVRAEQAPVQRDGRQQRERRGAQRRGARRGVRRVQETGGGTHDA